MEENLWKALHCTATKTELAVLSLYAQSVTHPYMRAIRAPGVRKINMLDLGPLHKRVLVHIQRIIADPLFLLGDSVTWEMGTMDGQKWDSPEIIEAVHRIAPTLPYLKPVLVAFFKGAASTWERFTSEFAPGGLIDEATAEEKELAWMPPTNDVNEGALGSFRLLMRRQPHLTALQYNAQAMYARNETYGFMEKKFQSDDYKYVRQLARTDDARGLELEKKKAIVEHAQTKINKRNAAREARQQKAAEVEERVKTLELIFDKGKIKNLKGESLKDHLRAFQNAGAPNLQGMPVRTLVGRIREGLMTAIDLYDEGSWKPDIHSHQSTTSGSSDSAEEIDLDVGESEWDDIED